MLIAKRAPDFAETGSYDVATASGTKVIYRDPENRNWYEARSEHYTLCFLGFTKVEALERLASLYGVPVPAVAA